MKADNALTAPPREPPFRRCGIAHCPPSRPPLQAVRIRMLKEDTMMKSIVPDESGQYSYDTLHPMNQSINQSTFNQYSTN
eukprot:3820989-Pyramimonas_sp.AAC.1